MSKNKGKNVGKNVAKTNIMIYLNHAEALDEFTNEEYGALTRALMEWGNANKDPLKPAPKDAPANAPKFENPGVAYAFRLLIADIRRVWGNYEEICETNRGNVNTRHEKERAGKGEGGGST